VIIDRRNEALANLRQSENPITVGLILKAFIHPYYDLASHGGPGWWNYARLIAFMSQSERNSHILDKYMQRTVRIYLLALQEALPHASHQSIKSGFYYAITLMMASFSGIHRIKGLVEGKLSGNELEHAYKPLIVYAEAGILALVAMD
jgi:hypothetical protein